MAALEVKIVFVLFLCGVCLAASLDYEVVYPIRIDGTNEKRAASTRSEGKDHDDEATFSFETNDGEMVLNVKRTKGIHPKKILLRTFDDDGNANIELYSPDSCYYDGKITTKKESHVLLNTCNGIRGIIEDGDTTYNIEPIATKQDGAHKLYKAEKDDDNLDKRTIGIVPAVEDFLEMDDDGSETVSKVSVSVSEDEPMMNFVPEVDPQYKAYSITNKTRFIEMYLVIDNAIYEKYNRNRSLIMERMLDMIHSVDRSYAAVNLRLVLVAVEIWTDKNKINYTTSGGAHLSAFNIYRRNNLVGILRHDIAHYISDKGWSGGVIGMAYVGGICHTGYGTGIDKWSFSALTGPTVVLAHELGHNMGFPHDKAPCKCMTTRGCFMGGPKTRRPGFSDCNMKVLSNPKRSFECLNNYPTGSLDNFCGNGIVEGTEECDCGTPEMCKKKDSCCEPNGCKLKRSAQCSDMNTPDCCKNCVFKLQGTLCRESQNDCDLPEYCPGNAGACPADNYRKDGTPCSNEVTILPANTDRWREKMIELNPPVIARYLRINPIYKKLSGSYCMRLEVLTCSANEDVLSQPQPISTPDLYYTKAVCLETDSDDCAGSKANDTLLKFKKEKYADCNKPNAMFVLENDGTLRHHCSGKIVCPQPSGGFVPLKKDCPNDQGKFERLANFGLKHKNTGNCLESYDGWPRDGKKLYLRSTKNCQGRDSRTKLHFLKTDCLMQLGLENKKLPDSALTASASQAKYPAHEARIQTGKGWCLPKNAGKNNHLQIDMGKVMTVGKLKTQGAAYSWVSGFKLFFSDDGSNWKGYSATGDKDKGFTSYCYSGSCSESLNRQCKDLWDPAATSANESCWNELNIKANGFGTCDPAKNKSCTAQNVFCGQLQCSSKTVSPQHVKYGSVYKNITLNGAKCSTASITIPGKTPNDQLGDGLGMVAAGTKCGAGKICADNKCQSFADLKIKQCGKANGLVCAGQGHCDNEGVCHCDRGYDPDTNCSTALISVDGKWGQWSQWSTCTAACNGGKRYRHHFCDSPSPAHGGKDCAGSRKENDQCNSEKCPKARSCRELMNKLTQANKPLVDGIYDIAMDDGKLMKMYCDMTRDGGGWTLIVSSQTNDWTSSDMVRERNVDKPGLFNDYSILKFVDQIKDSYKISDDEFEYRLEAQRRGHWGGIWSAPSVYKIDTTSSSQTDVKLTKKFDKWSYHKNGLQERMPYVLNNRLTLQTRNGWASITGNDKSYHPAPWMGGHLEERKPEHIWYWFREGSYAMPVSCMDIRSRLFAKNQIPKSGAYEIQSAKGKTLSALCDMDSFGGGWTMVLNKVSNRAWNKETTLSRNTHLASKSEDYSILFHSKEIINKPKEESTFQYLIEADGDKRWGGVFEGEKDDGLISSIPSSQKPKLLKKFDTWDDSNSNFLSSNPYVVDCSAAYFTTALKASAKLPGVLLSEVGSVYIKGLKETPSFVRLWVREGASYKSCNQLKVKGQRKGGIYKNGFYNLQRSGADILTVYCDMTSDIGAWTLLVTSTHGSWTKQQVLSRNENRPSVMNDYSILGLADGIKALSNNATFKYKLDANRFNHWGGIFEAPIGYTFTSESYKLSEVKLLKQFDKWAYNVWYKSVNNRMPWRGGRKGILTTSGTADSHWWGTIISDSNEYKPAPWINSEMANPGVIWYWVNEDDCSPDRMPVNGGFTPWSAWSQCSVNCGEGLQKRGRSCINPKPRCGGEHCDSTALTKEEKICQGKCLITPIRTKDEQYCAAPGNGGCNPADETIMHWKKGKCDSPEAQFIFDPDTGTITHNCSGKAVCPKGGSTAYGAKIVVSSKCPAMELKKRFMRTHSKSINFGNKCIHPNGGYVRDNVELVLWAGCLNEKLVSVFYKIEFGPVHVRFWNSIKHTYKNVSDLTNDVRFPNNPKSSGFLDNFDTPYSLGSNYGMFLWSYFAATESGLYTFYAACDDYCQVFLSTSTSQKDKQKIVDVKSWSSQYQYDKRAEQKSGKIALEVGKLYYLEAIMVEAGGGDHVSVAVKFPSGKFVKPLNGFYLRSKAES